MRASEKHCLLTLIAGFKQMSFTNDEIYERIKKLIKPLTPEQYQERIKFIAKEIYAH